MITFKGFDEAIGRAYENGQGHLFDFWDQLNEGDRRTFMKDIQSLDFNLLKTLHAHATGESRAPMRYEPAEYIPLPADSGERLEWDRARVRGEEAIRSGKVAAFLVAGGQGSRLGFEGPKGMFGVGPVSGKSLFQIHAEKILKYSRKYGTSVPWLIMTSEANHEDTVAYLRDHGYFGLDEHDVIIFPQSMIPSMDSEGRLILEGPGRIFRNPDGHGGSLTALAHSGALAEMERRGVEIISYFQVDNPLVRILDPVFIGFHVLRGADISSKGLMKAYPGEKIGVFVKFQDGTTGVVEYSDLPADLQEARDSKGSLRYCMGSIAIHLFGTRFLDSITGGSSLSLPFHVARKQIRSFTRNGTVDIDGFKFEKFVFDALPLTPRTIVLETLREDEFAPVKNPSGVDSAESARALMDGQCRRWLSARGIALPAAVRVIEISPLLAVEPDDLPGNLVVPDRKEAYLE
jgi:UDP-N-acetylglucosamine/UDP-N-acetylgalactosamine diphosphorylase